MADNFNLIFNEKDLKEIKICLNCPMEDCSEKDCPFSITNIEKKKEAKKCQK